MIKVYHFTEEFRSTHEIEILKVVKRWSEITHFCMTTILAKSLRDKMTT